MSFRYVGILAPRGRGLRFRRLGPLATRRSGHRLDSGPRRIALEH